MEEDEEERKEGRKERGDKSSPLATDGAASFAAIGLH